MYQLHTIPVSDVNTGQLLEVFVVFINVRQAGTDRSKYTDVQLQAI